MPSDKTALQFHDILDQINHIEQFTDGLSKEAFQHDVKTRLAVERLIAIISKAAVKLGEDGPMLATDIPWDLVLGATQTRLERMERETAKTDLTSTPTLHPA